MLQGFSVREDKEDNAGAFLQGYDTRARRCFQTVCVFCRLISQENQSLGLTTVYHEYLEVLQFKTKKRLEGKGKGTLRGKRNVL